MNEQLINRARSLLSFMTKKQAVKKLVESGVDIHLAFLAVSAGQLAEDEHLPITPSFHLSGSR